MYKVGSEDRKAHPALGISYRIGSVILGVVLGALFLIALSIVQKLIISAPLAVEGFIIPALFGGASGGLLFQWGCKIWLANKKLRDLNLRNEILLMELHHRVKNNLQLISSMMNLSELFADEKNQRDLLHRVRSRVLVLAHIQENLYHEASSLEAVRVDEFISSVISYLKMSYGVNERAFDVRIEPIYCRMCETIPLGMLLYEVLSNAIQHGLLNSEGTGDISEEVSGGSTRKPASIRISFTAKSDNFLQLLVQDRGPGFPFDGSPFDQACLGLQFIDVLSQQLEGEIEVDSDQGVRYLITLPCCGRKHSSQSKDKPGRRERAKTARKVRMMGKEKTPAG